MLAIEERASNTCARLMRGTQSMAYTVILFWANFSISSLFWAGYKKLINVPFSRNFSTSSSNGPRTFKIMSELKTSLTSWKWESQFWFGCFEGNCFYICYFFFKQAKYIYIIYLTGKIYCCSTDKLCNHEYAYIFCHR